VLAIKADNQTIGNQKTGKKDQFGTCSARNTGADAAGLCGGETEVSAFWRALPRSGSAITGVPSATGLALPGSAPLPVLPGVACVGAMAGGTAGAVSGLRLLLAGVVLPVPPS
jgi:hypothetical protein